MICKLPPKGSLVGVNPKTVCDECKRTKEEKKVKAFRRPHLVDPRDIDPVKCLLEQGIVCNGPAVHAGCGALCPQVNLGCRGCYGPADGIQDVGAKLGGPSPRSSTATTPLRSRPPRTRSSTRSARSTGSAWPARS